VSDNNADHEEAEFGDFDEPGRHRADWHRVPIGEVRPHYFRIESVSAEMCADCGAGPTDPAHLDAKHLRPYPGLGQSRWLSIDHHLLAYQERFERAEAEVMRLRYHLEFIEAMGANGGSVAGEPLALYARVALDGQEPPRG
jgi:hypothetical protein